jgi:hypothetical protein
LAERSKITHLIAEIERAAYQRGLDEAARAINQALVKLGVQNFSKKPPEDGAERFVVRPNSDSAVVLAAVKIHPGQRGSDLHKILLAGERPINERTMRTALRRLSGRGVIEQRGGRWYVRLPGATEELANQLKLGGGGIS